MKSPKILVIGALGQLGTALLTALRAKHGDLQVIAADIREVAPDQTIYGPYLSFDVLHRPSLEYVVKRYEVTQIYHLAAVLSATGEQDPQRAWDINMQSLLNVLEVAREQRLDKVFWPSSIAVFGNSSPIVNCPQQTVMEPQTSYGISKLAGEQWCHYYFQKYGVDVRSLRYPGLIGYNAMPGGGTTDYAVDIFHQALQKEQYTCFPEEGTMLPMMYMPDAVRATLELMDAPAHCIRVRTAYNIAGTSFTPAELAAAIRQHLPGFSISYEPDSRQQIADSWPGSIDDSAAYTDWGWESSYGMSAMVREMLQHLVKKYPLKNHTNPLLHPAVFS